MTAYPGTIPILETLGNVWTSHLFLGGGASVFSAQKICFSPSLSLFVAVGAGGNRVARSSDGRNWILGNSADDTKTWAAAAWSPALGIFAAISPNGTTNGAMISSDGINWTSKNISDAAIWRDMCWSPALGMFVGVGGLGWVVTSTDGNTWTAAQPNTNAWRSVCWSPSLGLLVAVAVSGTNRVMTSTNGTVWNTVLVPSNVWNAVCWCDTLGLFVAVTGDGISSAVMTSSTGTSGWTPQTAIDSGGGWNSIAFGNGIIIAFRNSGSFMISINGTSWSSQSAPTGSSYWQSICFGLGGFVGGGYGIASNDGYMMSGSGLGVTADYPRAADENVPNREIEAICQTLGTNPRQVIDTMVPTPAPTTVAQVLDMYANILKTMTGALTWWQSAVPNRFSICGRLLGATIPASVTRWTEPFSTTLLTATTHALFPMTYGCKFRMASLRIETLSAQPADGALSVLTNKGYAFDITKSGAAGIYYMLFGGQSGIDFSFAVNDPFYLRLDNNSASASAQLGSWTAEFDVVG